jgi:Uma2 family endonuclease
MTQTLITLEEFLQQAETKPASEYACGRIAQKPMPTGPHALVQGMLTTLLFLYAEQSGLGEAFVELRCIFGPPDATRAYVPDLCFVSNQHLPVMCHLLTAPDLAVEVLSPEQPWPEFLSKVQFFLLNGVRLVWIADPETRTVTVESPGQEAAILQIGDTLDGGTALPGFSVPVERIFSRLGQP